MYTNAIQMDRSFADAYMKRADLYERLGRYTEAMADMEQALHYNPMSGYIHDRRQKLQIMISDPQGMDAGSIASQDLAPYEEILRREKIDRWLMEESPQNALAELDTLLLTAPNDTTLILKKGFIHLATNDLDSAMAVTDRVLELNPNSALAHDLRGLTFMRSGEPENAIAEFSAAITVWPEFAWAYYNRGVAYRSIGMNDAALVDLDKAMDLGREHIDLLYNRALAHKASGDLRSAEADYTAALAIDPLAVDLLYNRSFTRKHLGDRMGAMRDAEAALGLNTSDPMSWNQKGDLHLLFGEYLEAIEHYSRAINLDPNAAEHYYDRGLARMMSHQLIEGCRDLERSQELGLPEATTALEYFCAF